MYHQLNLDSGEIYVFDKNQIEMKNKQLLFNSFTPIKAPVN